MLLNMIFGNQFFSLRTTNTIERLNEEFKRRTRPIESVAGEHACSMLLAFVFIKMKLHWKSNPVGKVPKNLAFFKDHKFTQKRVRNFLKVDCLRIQSGLP